MRVLNGAVLFLIGGMLTLGIAMETTGMAQFLANGIVDALGRFKPTAILAGIYILAALITEPCQTQLQPC